MEKQDNSYLTIQDRAEDNRSNQNGEILQLGDRQRSRLVSETSFHSNTSMSDQKVMGTMTKNNKNQQLQDLLQSQTIIDGQTTNLSTQKGLLPELSFLSKDYTHDHTNQEGYNEVMNKLHFQRSRNRQLNQQLAQQKQRIIHKYLKDLMEQFRQLSQGNKNLRDKYKKQAGGAYKKTINKNQSIRQQQHCKSYNYNLNQNLNLNYPKTDRRNIAGGSVSSNDEAMMPNGRKYNVLKQSKFQGIGNNNFCQTLKLQTLRQSNKMQYCQSSKNFHGQSLVPSPKHKRRQSQLTERKDYPQKYKNENDCLVNFDNDSQISSDNRMSQPGNMSKRRYVQQVSQQQSLCNSSNWTKGNKIRDFAYSIQRNSDRMMSQSQVVPAPTSSKNIFIQFLQQLLLEEKVTYTQLTSDMNDQIDEQQHNLHVPSYKNIKFIQQLEKEIINKNLKLRQLQQVVNVFKLEIQQIMGTDVKIINELMIDLLEVKGKYIQMQDKVNGITGIRKELDSKKKIKEQILQNIKQRIDTNKRQAIQKQLSTKQIVQNFEVFHIPQSIKILFQLLNIKMKRNARPIDYLNQIKELPKNKQIFQAFGQKNRVTSNMKIKQIIDSIRQGRKKFNQVIKIYQGRIQKLQQKLMKYKNSQKNHQKGNQKQITVQK